MIWSHVVELMRAAIFVVAQLCNGSLGAAVILVSLIIRLAMLPLTLRLARRALRQQAALATIRPQLDHLRQRYAHDPARWLRETAELHHRSGIRQTDPVAIFGALAQSPPLLAIFGAVRRGLGNRVAFLWIGDLARRNVALAAGVAALSALGIWAAPRSGAPHPAGPVLAAIGCATTLAFLLSTPSALALSYGSGALVSLLQSWLLRRDRASLAAPVSVTRNLSR